jgi:Mn2+/Fe2+ NRAMP family transporter
VYFVGIDIGKRNHEACIIDSFGGGILMAPLLIFLVLMTSDKKLMGKYKTKLFGKVWGWLMVALLIGLSVATLWQTFTSF